MICHSFHNLMLIAKSKEKNIKIGLPIIFIAKSYTKITHWELPILTSNIQNMKLFHHLDLKHCMMFYCSKKFGMTFLPGSQTTACQRSLQIPDFIDFAHKSWFSPDPCGSDELVERFWMILWQTLHGVLPFWKVLSDLHSWLLSYDLSKITQDSRFYRILR